MRKNKEITTLAKDKKKAILKRYLMTAITCAIVGVFMVPVLAESEAETAINNMSNIIFGIIRAIGIILAGWGLVQVGMSFQSHDPSQRSGIPLPCRRSHYRLRKVYPYCDRSWCFHLS